MPYIGNSPVNVGNYNVLDDIASSFNGTLTTFALTINTGTSISPTQPGQLIINISNVMQEPDALGAAGFTISGSNIVFSSAPVAADTFWGIFLGTTLDIGIPSELSVGNAQTNFVSTSSAAGLNIKGDGTTDAYIQINCANNSHGVKIKSPAHSAGANYTLTLPVSDGNANEVLTTNGSGVLAWSADSTTDSTKLPLAGGTLTGPLGITTASTVDTVVLTRGTTGHNNMLKFKTGSADKWIVGQRNDSTDHFRFYSYGTSSDVLSILTDGKVGIGTAAPTFENGSGLEIRYAGGNGAHLKLTDNASGAGGTNGFDLYSFNTAAYIENYEAGAMVFRNNGAERMRITSDGKVGIGTTAPDATALHVKDNGQAWALRAHQTSASRHGLITEISGSSASHYGMAMYNGSSFPFKVMQNGAVTATSFSGAGTIDTVATTDPLVTTNPSATGHIWFNKTTGDIFTCTRNVTDENVWINSTDSGRHVRFKKSNGTADLFGDGSDKLHLTFNETLASSKYVRDWSGNFTCTADANVDFTKDSMFSTYAAKFNGNGEITIPFMSNTFRRTDAFTISLWITRKGDIPDGSLPFSFNGNSSTNGRGARVTGNNCTRVSTTTANSMYASLGASFTVNDGDHFIVIGYTDATSRVYKNGSIVGTTGAALSGHSNVSNSAGGSLGGFGNVYNPTGYDGHSYFNCTVNNFRVFNKAINSTEAATLYAEGY